MSQRTAHLIVGVPRSGTSAVAQLLSDGGVHFGDPAHFLDTAVHKHNPNFFEMEWVNELNNLAVEALGSQYSDDFLPIESDFDDPALDGIKERITAGVRAEFGEAPRIGIKDPRFCFTFPLWHGLLERMGYAVSAVITLRSEAACRRSNLALEPKWADDRTWSRFYLQSLLGARHFTRDVPTVVIDYDRLMADPVAYAARLDLPGVNLAEATAKLDPALVHQRPATDDGDALVARVQRKLRDGTLRADAYLDYRTVAALQVTDLAPAMARGCRAELAAVQAQRDAVQLHADQLTDVVTVKQAAVEHHERRAAELERQRAAVQLHADQLSAAVEVKQAAVEHHERRADELERQRAGLDLHAAQLTAEVAAKQLALEHHERRAADLEQRCAGLEQHAAQLADQVAAKQSAVEHHERRAAELDQQRAGLQLHADQLTAVVAAKQAAVDHHEARANALDAQRAALQEQIERLEAALAADRGSLAERAAACDRLLAQRAVLRASADAHRPGLLRRPAPLTEARLETVTATQSIVGTAPMSGRVRVELTATAPAATRASVYWDSGGPYDAARRVDLGSVDGPTSLSAEIDLTEPARGFWLEASGPLEISRLRIFCVGR